MVDTDSTELQGSLPVKIAGANPSTGAEDNFLEVDSAGKLTTKINDGSGNSITSSTYGTQQRLHVEAAPIDGQKATYTASVLGLVVANTPTDVFTISGSATKTVRVVRIGISATQNTSAVRDLILLKRSTANSGGTSTTSTNVSHDSNDASATAVIKAYTVNPTTLGNLVGNIRTLKMDIAATNLVGGSDIILWSFGDIPSKALVLRGTAETLAINLNSVTSSNNSFNFFVEFTEE